MNQESRIKDKAKLDSSLRWNDKQGGTLFVVATPIGNLGDITLRALETLKCVDLIACEDTRNTGKLLAHFEIKKPLVSYFQHSKLSKIEYIIEELLSGKNIALVTDAGTPGISDPGEQIVHQIREISNFQFLISNQTSNDQISNYLENSGLEIKTLIENLKLKIENSPPIKVIPIPGASALTAAASVSGMIEKEFYFAGFLPKKKGRQTKFKALCEISAPIVVYESANRLERTLADIRTYFGEDCQVFIAREITKMFEECWGGNVDELISTLGEHQLKGEIVLIVNKVHKVIKL